MSVVTKKLGPLKSPDPLTQSTRLGMPYARFADVERQITEIIQYPIDKWDTIIVGNSSRWKSQTLVYLARHALDDDKAFGWLLRQVLKRASTKLGFILKGMDPTTLQQIDTTVSLQLVELIMTEVPTRASEYLEVDFNGKVKQLAIKAAAKFETHPEPYQVSTASKSANGSDPLDAVAMPNDPYSSLATRIDQGMMRRLLKAVTDPRHRKAFILRKMRDWPMYHDDPTVPSVLRHFGLRSNQRRTVQYWIERAEKEMREAHGELE
ncbi:hypothetical protein [Rhizobium leguminosarum]|uniref:Uncharacterized protein n=1 Tax=Rhizobium leguminosarum TaxID=384 RepID=A0A2K9ZFX9_RHILE|nr:hypothetical protein [Rhizobium leguminosarum]AUW47162.1 hypothetical protein CUJ84_pRLN3000020 [Rhizobium leguminosarum]